MKSITKRFLGMAVLMAASLPLAAQAGDPAEGRRLSLQWCTSCHVVDEYQDRASDVAPPFFDIANDPERTSDGLRAWLADPHPPMPPVNLTHRETEDVIAYLESLREE